MPKHKYHIFYALVNPAGMGIGFGRVVIEQNYTMTETDLNDAEKEISKERPGFTVIIQNWQEF